MGKRFFITIFIAGLVLFGLYWLIYPSSNQESVDSEDTQQRQRVVEEAKENEETKEAPTPKKDEQQKPLSIEESKSKALSKWEELKQVADERNKACETAVKNLLPDDELIDPEHAFYKNREEVMQKLSDVFKESLFRPEAAKGYGQLQNLIINDFIDDPSNAYQGLIFFDAICRNFKSLNYVDTVLEAAIVNKWSPQEKSEATQFILDQVQVLLSNHFSPSNMGYVVSLFEGMIERGFLSKEYRDELHEFVRKVIDQEDIFLKGFDESDEESDQNNKQALKAYLSDNRSLGSELNDIISRLKSDIRNN